MTKTERIRGIVNECQMTMRQRDMNDEIDRGMRGLDRQGNAKFDKRTGRWGDQAVHDRGIGGGYTHVPTPSSIPNTTHIDNPPIDKSLKDFNDIAQRHVSSIMNQPCPVCHGTGRMSISIVNGNTVMDGNGIMRLTGTHSVNGHGLGG